MAYMKLDSGIRNTLNQRAIDAIYSQLELETMCNLAASSKDLETMFLRIWRHNPFYHDNLYNQHQVSDECYRYFICKNAPNFHSLRMYTSDIPTFNEATKKLVLHNLKNLEIVWDSHADDTISADFLGRCTILQNVFICHQIMRFQMRNIVELRTLKSLHILYDKEDNMDDLLVELISRKGASIRRIYAKIEQFPPRWLMGSAMAECQNLKSLALDARMSRVNRNFCADYLEKRVPTLKSLEKLRIIGDGICMKQLMAILNHFPNLKKLEIDRPDRVAYVNIVMKLEKRNKPFQVVESNFVFDNETCIKF